MFTPDLRVVRPRCSPGRSRVTRRQPRSVTPGATPDVAPGGDACPIAFPPVPAAFCRPMCAQRWCCSRRMGDLWEERSDPGGSSTAERLTSHPADELRSDVQPGRLAARVRVRARRGARGNLYVADPGRSDDGLSLGARPAGGLISSIARFGWAGSRRTAREPVLRQRASSRRSSGAPVEQCPCRLSTGRSAARHHILGHGSTRALGGPGPAIVHRVRWTRRDPECISSRRARTCGRWTIEQRSR